VDINTLAASQSLATTAYSNITDTVGTGSLQIRFGAITGPGFGSFSVNPEKTNQTITVDSSNNTLAGLKDYINAGDYGVTASIINDGTGYRLTLTSNDTGASNAMELSVTDTGDGNDLDASGLSALAYNASATNLVETQAAVDASVSINGLAITASTNTLSEVIEGVTLNLKETTTSTLTLNINESQSQLSNSIRDVVDSYNELIGSLDDLGFAGGEGAQSGLLVGDASLRTFTSSLRRLLTSNVEGLTGSITALSNIGITTQLDGRLAIDETKFSDAISENPTGALALFAPVGRTSDSLIEFNSSGDNSQPGNYGIVISTIPTQAALNGASGVNNLVVDADNDNLTLLINGESTGTLSLTQGTYSSATALASEIQSQINSASALSTNGISVGVSYDSANDRFVITSDDYGSSSSIEITSVDTDSTLDFGLSVATGTDGIDVAGSIGGATATGNGRTLSTSSGLSVEVLGGTTGSRGSLEFTRGFVESLNDLLDNYLDGTDGSLSAREQGLNGSLEDIAEERIALDLRLEAVEARLVAQFSALDQLVAQFQNTGNFISQQIGNLPGSGSLVNRG
ncbi:MAG: flagellar filament capping protein FliD, partial [Pseudomonadota bacterium]